ncbi:MAG: DUF1349 domain-containing protein, partial [Planctomycetes bacterium]|nr:DUF1349 domain-containing protein [Planctomycetota bacterium]
MCNKLFLLFMSFVLVLAIAGSAGADAVPGAWANQDIGGDVVPPGSADYNPATPSLAVTGQGHDIWDNQDDFHYVYMPWTTGDCDLIARVVSFPGGPSGWQKAGVMVRQNLTDGSQQCMMVVTGTDGGGAAMQWRDTQDGGSNWTGADAPGVTEPEYIRLTRTGNVFTAFNSEDGITWQSRGTHNLTLTDPVYIGFAVTSHSTGNLVTATFDSFGGDISFETSKASGPNPAHLAVDVPVDANVTWTRGDGADSDQVYFGTDPGALPLVANLLTIFPAEYNPPGDLIASTTYSWQIVEVNDAVQYPGP